ncbi:MAG: NUDIX domain-containing protein [Caldilineae bacterium]|nr:MAG: NUDIX domain-containing protein [Caldilineae bacterium]
MCAWPGRRPVAELHFRIGEGVTREARIRLGCSITIVDDEGRVLLQKRRDGDWWGLPGGGVDPGETFTAAAIRETREETGLEVEIVRLLGAFTEPDICVCYPDGSRVQIASLNFLARIVGGRLIESNGETAELRWFGADNLPANLMPTHRRRLAHFFAAPERLHVD